MRRWRITVDQAAIQRGDANVIHVHDSEKDTRINCSDLGVEGRVFVHYDREGGLQDGSRVWIETDATPIIQVGGTKP